MVSVAFAKCKQMNLSRYQKHINWLDGYPMTKKNVPQTKQVSNVAAIKALIEYDTDETDIQCHL